MLVGTIMNEFQQEVPISIIYDNRFSNIFSNFHRNTKFFNGKVRIRCNNRTSREINTFTHKIASDTTTFSINAFFDRFQRSPRTLRNGRSTWNIIIYDCRNIILQNSSPVIDYMGLSILRNFLL